jgi:hypothetical protein
VIGVREQEGGVRVPSRTATGQSASQRYSRRVSPVAGVDLGQELISGVEDEVQKSRGYVIEMQPHRAQISDALCLLAWLARSSTQPGTLSSR